MNKKKLLYIITQGGPWGGAQKYVFDLATGLTDQFDVTIAVGENKGPNDLQKKLMAANLPLTVIQLKYLVRNISPLHDILAISECTKLFQKLQPDIIHANSSKAGIIASFAKIFGHSTIPLVYTVHGWVTNEPLNSIKKWGYRVLERQTAKQKAAYIILSPQDRETARDVIALPEQKIKLIPLGIEQSAVLSHEDARKKIREQCRLSENTTNTFWIGSIANFYRTKGIDTLVDAIAGAAKHIPNLRVFLIGDGPERSEIEGLITKNHLESVIHLTGFLENASQYLSAFDLFALASRKEGTPYTILEAIKNGTPVVATAVGGVPSLVEHTVTGWIVPSENASALSNAIVYAYQHPEDRKRAALAGANRLISISDMAQSTTSLYQRLLSSRPQ